MKYAILSAAALLAAACNAPTEAYKKLRKIVRLSPAYQLSFIACFFYNINC